VRAESAFRRRGSPFDEVSAAKARSYRKIDGCFSDSILSRSRRIIQHPVIKIFLTTLGWSLARTPEACLHGLAIAAGDAIYFLLPRRRRILLANLDHVFPERGAAWARRTGRTSCRRMVETALLSLASPFLDEARLRRIARPTPSVESWLRSQVAQPQPTVVATVHCAYWETETWLAPVYAPLPIPKIGVIFRPLDNAAADAFIQATRERHGIRLLSRKEGFSEALKMLRGRQVVAVLFDQNSGARGELTTFFGRVCSTTVLPGLLAEKFGAEVRVIVMHTRRIGFWRVEHEMEALRHDGSSAGVTIALNCWLESALSNDDELCASWLWAHDRWRHQDVPEKRLRLESRHNLLAADLAAHGLSALPRRTRIWVRLPNWLGDVVVAFPLLRALRASRPDAELTLIGRPAFAPLAEKFGVADRYEPLPPRGPGYFWHFWRLRRRYPDTFILFTASIRSDLEAWLTRCPQRFGLLRQGKTRPLLTRRWPVPADFDERQNHQLALWGNFLRAFGLDRPPDRRPMELKSQISNLKSIGLIVGSENSPEKRWPAAYWRSLVTALPETAFVIFGTAGDAPIAAAVADGFGPRVENRAGRTDLSALAEQLAACRLLVTNDTGGMHLANALGVPLIALFGPTNPVRTGPVFAAPFKILQPPGCAPAGGADLAGLLPDSVIAAVREQINR
jgi:heptosyltransferase-2